MLPGLVELARQATDAKERVIGFPIESIEPILFAMFGICVRPAGLPKSKNLMAVSYP